MFKRIALIIILAVAVSATFTSSFVSAIDPKAECSQIFTDSKEVEACTNGFNAGSNADNQCSSLAQHGGSGGNVISACHRGGELYESYKDSSFNSANETGCNIGGLGYLVCQVSRIVGWLADGLFNVLASQLKSKPLDESTPGGTMMKNIWSKFAALGNVILIIVFLAIVWSQITGFGIGNYGIKKLLPRLVIGAILINSSYITTGVLIDVTNILGSSINEVLSTVAIPAKFGFNGWSNLILLCLTAGAGVAIYLNIFAIAPALISGVFALFMTVVFLVVRQALIIMLVILSPLAFALNIMPSTQEWFGKWWKMFFSSLMLFPVISFIFGGSKIAAGIIGASAPSGATMTIIFAAFALGAQSIPFFATPMLMKLGGGAMNKLMGVVNNPSKGLFDRGKNRAKQWGDTKQNQRMANWNDTGKRDPRGLYARHASKRAATDAYHKQQLTMGGGGALDDYLGRANVRAKIGNSVAFGTGAEMYDKEAEQGEEVNEEEPPVADDGAAAESTPNPPAEEATSDDTSDATEEGGEAGEEIPSYNSDRAESIGAGLERLSINAEISAIEAAEAIFDSSPDSKHQYSREELKDIYEGRTQYLKDGSAVTDDEKNAAMNKLAREGTVDDIHKILSVMDQNKTAFGGAAFESIAKSIGQNNNIKGTAAHLEGSGLQQIQSGNVNLGSLYANSIANGGWTPESQSRQSAATVRGLTEVNLSPEHIRTLTENQKKIDGKVKYQANQSASAAHLLHKL